MFVDWSDFTYSSDGSNAFPKLFSLSKVSIADALPDTESITPAIWKGHIGLSAGEMVDLLDPAAHSSHRRFRRFSVDISNVEHPEEAAVLTAFSHQIRRLRKHFVGDCANWAKQGDDQILAELLRTCLHLDPSIRQKVETWKDRLFRKGHMIGVHVRFMDRRTSLKSFIDALKEIEGRFADPVLFLATDNKEAEAEIKALFANVVVTEKWFPTTGISMHQNPECPDRLQNAVEALIDMYLLSECDCLVYPGSSTFSHLSRLIGNLPDDRVVDVEARDPIIRAKKLVRSWLS